MKLYKICIILLLSLLISAKEDVSDSIKLPSGGNPAGNIALENAVITKDESGKDVFAIKDLSYKGNTDPRITDILLSFNQDPYQLTKDDTGKYIIQNASYKFIKDKNVLGGGCAGFFKKDNIIEIEPSKNLWLGSCNDLGSFTLEFRFLPVSFSNESILFSRIGYFSGKKNGIEIKIKNKKIIIYLFHIFKDSKQLRYDVKLLKGIELELNRWYHFMLSFDRVSGKLARYINGMEEEVVYVTETDKPFENVYAPSFECLDLPVSFIGRNYTGYIDEFRISYRQSANLEKETNIAFENHKKVELIGREPLNGIGILTSPVYNFESTGTSVTLFNWSELLKDNTFIWMEFRTNDGLFDINDRDLKWYRVINNQRNIYLMKDSGEYMRGKYYQWRAYLVPSPDGKFSPYLYDVELSYRLDIPPKAPQFVEVMEAGDRYIILRWNKNVEHDIMGYRIYYGVEQTKYNGIISYIDGQRITNDLNSNRRYIEVKITNDIIEENKTKDTTEVLEYPMLSNTTLYFLSVSAYDSYKPDTAFNHESSLSKEVKARPYAGSEIKL